MYPFLSTLQPWCDTPKSRVSPPSDTSDGRIHRVHGAERDPVSTPDRRLPKERGEKHTGVGPATRQDHISCSERWDLFTETWCRWYTLELNVFRTIVNKTLSTDQYGVDDP